MPAEPKAVLWDFDGTLVDTEPVWKSCERAILADHGFPHLAEEWETPIGISARVSAGMLAEAVGSDDAEALLADLHDRVAGFLRRGQLPYLPGARELLTELGQRGTPAAIVTASSGFIVDAARDRLPEHISFVITSDDVQQTKPHPEAYQLAMARLGVGPDEVVVLEDSAAGAQSALSAGAVVYAVPSAPIEPHPRLHIGDTLVGVTWQRLTQVWQSVRAAA